MGARVRTRGRLQVEWDGERLEEALPGRQGRLLFAFLTLHRERLVRRDELVEALWSEDGPPPAGDALLRPPLSRLRSALGPGRLEGRGELAIALPGRHLDRPRGRAASGLRRGRALVRRRATRAGAGRRRGRRWRSPSAGCCPGLEARWLEPFRAELRGAARRAARDGRAGRRATGRRRAVRRPSRPPGARSRRRRSASRRAWRCSRCCAARGNVAEALVAFDEFRVFLREELGTSPGRELLALHEDLLRAGARRAARRAPPRRRGAGAAAAARPARAGAGRTRGWAARRRSRGCASRRTEAAAGEQRLVLVAGEGGIGKTRLVAELAAGLAGFDVLYGRCDEEEIFPYGPWVDMLRPRLDAHGRRRARRARSGRRRATSRGSLPELRRPPAGRWPATPHCGDPETERRLLFVAVDARRRPASRAGGRCCWSSTTCTGPTARRLLLGRHLAREPRLGPVLHGRARSATPSSTRGIRSPT